MGKKMKCPDCKGTGETTKRVTCGLCGGSGKVEIINDYGKRMTIKCYPCRGTGKVDEADTCNMCGGAGEIEI